MILRTADIKNWLDWGCFSATSWLILQTELGRSRRVVAHGTLRTFQAFWHPGRWMHFLRDSPPKMTASQTLTQKWIPILQTGNVSELCLPENTQWFNQEMEIPQAGVHSFTSKGRTFLPSFPRQLLVFSKPRLFLAGAAALFQDRTVIGLWGCLQHSAAGSVAQP